MTLTATPTGFYFPYGLQEVHGFLQSAAFVATLDATGEKTAFIGHCYIAGRAASKTISAAGGGAIQWHCSSLTFANGGTTIDIGIQDVSTSAGPPVRPDGTFDVKRTFTGGGGGITAGVNTSSMTGGSGTKTINHGDLIALVWDMTVRAGADGINQLVATLPGAGHLSRPINVQFLGGAWSVITGQPIAAITFDDGTLGWLDGIIPYTTPVGALENFSDSSNPDERGLMFTMPWDCKIDAFLCLLAFGGAATADATIKLYSDPLGTPSLVTSLALLGEQGSSASTTSIIVTLPSEVSLTGGTVYGLTVLATGAANVTIGGHTLFNAAHRVFLPGDTTRAKITRNNSTGAFTAESPAITQYGLGVRISQLHNTSGGGGGGLNVLGGGGVIA